jgi:PAS domain S-box-containing protein
LETAATTEQLHAEIADLRHRLADAEQAADGVVLRSLLSASADCIKILDLDGHLLFMSEGGQRTMEVAEFETLRGRFWPDFWQGVGHEAALAAIEHAKAGRAGRFDGLANTAAGTPKWWDVQVTPILGQTGQPEKLLAVSRDITVAHKAEIDLLEAQGLNTPILNSSRDCIVVLDLEGHTQFVSPGGIEAMDIADVTTVLGKSWLRVWKDADLAAARAALAEARAGGIGRFQGFCPTHKGVPKWWDLILSPLQAADGQPDRLVSIGRDITALKQTEQELARADEQLGLALGAAIMVGLWDWDLTTDLVRSNGNLARLYGVDPAAALRGAPQSAYIANIHPDDLPHYKREVEAVFAGKPEFLLEYRLCQPNGSCKWMLARGSLVRNEAGEPVRFPGVVVDITDRRNTELRNDALLKLGDRLRDLHDVTEMAQAAAEIVGETVVVSRAGYGTIDPAREAIHIEPDWTAPGVPSLAGTYSFADYGSFIDDLKRGDTVVVQDTQTDPRTRQMAASWESVGARALINVPIFEQNELVALFLVQRAEPRAWLPEETAFVQNAADRTHTAIERRRAEQRLQALAESLEREVVSRTADRNRVWQLSTSLIMVTTFDRTILAVNPAWTNLLGWTEAELIGRNARDLIHPDDLSRTIESTGNVEHGETLLRLDNRYRHHDGSYRWISWTAVPAEGVINAIGRDFTAEHEQAEALALAEDRLRQSQKMEAVGQLTGGLAHDFNNLLTGIAGSLELLGLRLAEGRITDLDRYIVAAQGAAKRAASLTHRLLAFSRQQTLDPQPTNFNRLVADMEGLIRGTVGPAITTEIVGAAGLWPALVDVNQMENALLNLCINARDAMPDGGRLTIETANAWMDDRTAALCDLPPGQYVSLRVTDTGTGMTEQVMKRAFDPFFTTKPIGQGTGLGLSMIHGFARQSGGQVRIYSQPSQGTTMCVYLPRWIGEIAAESDPAVALPARVGQGETVLVVDDEIPVRMLVTEVLGDLGFACIVAGDGPAGLKMLQAHEKVDLLITDVGLPGGMNGKQFADAARVLRPELKVLFMTGYAQNAAIGHAHLDAGMQVLTKPFSIETLATRIATLLGRA